MTLAETLRREFCTHRHAKSSWTAFQPSVICLILMKDFMFDVSFVSTVSLSLRLALSSSKPAD